MQIYPSSRFTAKDVVYCVYQGEDLVHIGMGTTGGSVRIFSSLATIAKDTDSKLCGLELDAWYVEVQAVGLRVPKLSGINEATNLERLLQVGFYYQFEQLPKEDEIPGGKGSDATRRGGFLSDQKELEKIFELLDLFCAKSAKKPPRCWSNVWSLLSESDAPVIKGSLNPAEWFSGGPGRPPSRNVFPAFWMETDRGSELYGCNLGWAPETKGCPALSTALANECVWHRLLDQRQELTDNN